MKHGLLSLQGAMKKGPEKWLEVSGKQTSLVYEAPQRQKYIRNHEKL